MAKVQVELNDDGRIEILSEYVYKDRVKMVPGTRWDQANRKWTAPCSWATCKILRNLFGEKLEIGENLVLWAKNELESRVIPSTYYRMQTDVKNEEHKKYLDPRMYPFQMAGALFLSYAQQAILGDPVGAGKTIQAICAAKVIKPELRHRLVVCPATMRLQWAREITIWDDPGIPIHIVQGSAAERNKIIEEAAFTGGWLIINWEAVRLHSRLAPYGAIALSDKEKTPGALNFIDWDLVIVDEAHRMKDPASKQTRATIAAAGDAPWRWALTGTLLTNAPETGWPILNFLNKKEWPSKSAFIDRYCSHGFNSWGGLQVFGILPEMEQEFFEIFHPRFRRMPKEVVLKQLPPIIRIRKDVQMSPKQRAAYRNMADNMVTMVGDDMLIAKNPISQFTRLLQFSSSYAEINAAGDVVLSDPSAKLDCLMDDLNDYLADEEGVVVFAYSRQLIEMAAARLAARDIKHSVIKGGQSPIERQQAIDDFQSKKVDVILVVILAGGVGITLTRGRIAIFLQRSFSQVDMIQAEGRIHRIGSEIHDAVYIVDYIASGTIEEYQLDILEGKAGKLEEIVRDKEAIRKLLGNG